MPHDAVVPPVPNATGEEGSGGGRGRLDSHHRHRRGEDSRCVLDRVCVRKHTRFEKATWGMYVRITYN